MALEYFTEAELRALPDVSDTTRYPLARVEVVAAYVVSVFEGFCGFSFIPRSHTELHSGTDANRHSLGIVLSQRRPLAVTSLEQDGVAVSTSELVLRRGVVKRFASGATVPQEWNAGIDNLEIVYTAGYSAVPGDTKEAALQATRARLLSTNSNAGIDDRRTSLTTELGTVNFVIAGEDRPTGYPEVDAVLLSYKKRRAPLVAS